MEKTDDLEFLVLSDNTAAEGLESEWGLSILITFRGTQYLLDAGGSDLFARNAEKLDVDLTQAEYAVLSHAHFDHADGLPAFFRVNKKAKCLLREGTRENCYDCKNEQYNYVGIPKGMTEDFAERIEFTKGNVEIIPDVYLIPHTIPQSDEEAAIASLFIEKDGKFIPDPFEHEHSLVFRLPKGLVIFNSCSHTGAPNIIREIQESFPNEKVFAYIGGLHTYRWDDDRIRALARDFRNAGIEHLYTDHCTGSRQTALLCEELGENCKKLFAGMKVRL